MESTEKEIAEELLHNPDFDILAYPRHIASIDDQVLAGFTAGMCSTLFDNPREDIDFSVKDVAFYQQPEHRHYARVMLIGNTPNRMLRSGIRLEEVAAACNVPIEEMDAYIKAHDKAEQQFDGYLKSKGIKGGLEEWRDDTPISHAVRRHF